MDAIGQEDGPGVRRIAERWLQQRRVLLFLLPGRRDTSQPSHDHVGSEDDRVGATPRASVRRRRLIRYRNRRAALPHDRHQPPACEEAERLSVGRPERVRRVVSARHCNQVVGAAIAYVEPTGGCILAADADKCDISAVGRHDRRRSQPHSCRQCPREPRDLLRNG